MQPQQLTPPPTPQCKSVLIDKTTLASKPVSLLFSWRIGKMLGQVVDSKTAYYLVNLVLES